jgi:hypothetical protein
MFVSTAEGIERIDLYVHAPIHMRGLVLNETQEQVSLCSYRVHISSME